MGLLNPSALIFASLYVLLVLLYLWERRRRQIEVPSLLLWRTASDDVVQARRFRPDWLFVLQVLLLGALITGLARPYFTDGRPIAEARRHIFILDTSASMQAREGRTTRFAAARAEMERELDKLPGGDEIMLISAAAHPEVVVNFTRDRTLLQHTLDELAPTDTGTELDLALAVAAGARQRSDANTDVQVFTDIPRSQLSPRWRDDVTVTQVGETDANLAITGLQIFQGRFQDARAARANIVVQNFSHRDGHGVLTVRLNDALVLRTGFTIPPRDTRAFFVPSFPGPGRVLAQIDADIDGDDALTADNVALGWIRPTIPTPVLLVSAESPLVDEITAVAHAATGLQIATVTPEGFDGVAAAYAAVIFHRVVPTQPLTKPALFIDPPPGSPLFAMTGEAHGVEVLDWNDQHEAVGALRPLAALPIQHARMIAPADWQQPLLLSRTVEREFPLALAGEHDGQRIACIAFDLEAERLLSSDNVNFLLFFLNLMSWLAPAPAEALVTTTGSVLPLTDLPALPATATDPHGRRIDLGDGAHASLEVQSAGEYRINVDGTSRVVYANFFDPIESDIGRAAKEPPAPPRAIGASAAPVMRSAALSEFGWWLFAAALALLLLEWLAAARATEPR